jgi:hypothetical protein
MSYYEGTVEDITHRKQAAALEAEKEAAVAASQAKSGFLAHRRSFQRFAGRKRMTGCPSCFTMALVTRVRPAAGDPHVQDSAILLVDLAAVDGTGDGKGIATVDDAVREMQPGDQRLGRRRHSLSGCRQAQADAALPQVCKPDLARRVQENLVVRGVSVACQALRAAHWPHGIFRLAARYSCPAISNPSVSHRAAPAESDKTAVAPGLPLIFPTIAPNISVPCFTGGANVITISANTSTAAARAPSPRTTRGRFHHLDVSRSGIVIWLSHAAETPANSIQYHQTRANPDP